MNSTIPALPFAGSLFVGMLLFLEAGRRLSARQPAPGAAGRSVVESALFALFGLLIAFTFSGAIQRFDSRRMLIAEEANDIGTAYLRLDLLAQDDQAALRPMFREYLESRLSVYRKLPDVDAVLAELQRSAGIQNNIWARSVSATRRPEAHPHAAMLLLPAVNAMIDITTTRTMAARTHPPVVIYGLLFVLGLGCALAAGFALAASGGWSWPYAMGFAAFVALTAFVILEIEYPRSGLIRLSEFDSVLVELLDSMK